MMHSGVGERVGFFSTLLYVYTIFDSLALLLMRKGHHIPNLTHILCTCLPPTCPLAAQGLSKSCDIVANYKDVQPCSYTSAMAKDSTMDAGFL